MHREDGLVLVRRFTEELEGATTLECAAITAQQQQDATEKQIRRRRMEAMYRDPGGETIDSAFHEMEAARLALQKACKEIESSEIKPSALSKIGRSRKSAQGIANDAVLSSSVHDFKGLRSTVESFESQWKAGQGRIGQRFRKVCSKLDDHKAAFAIFPSQDLYTSALCGSLALIVGAAVNHHDIADKLSEMVADIADKATRAASMVMIYRTKNFRDLFSDLYAQVFLFYRDAIQWYAKSKVARAFDSFNANLVKPYERAAAKIESLVVEIYREADVAKSAQLAVFVEDFEDRLRDQRHQYTDQDDLIFAGRQGQRLMLLMHETARLEDGPPQLSESRRIEPADAAEDMTVVEGFLNREDTRAYRHRLEAFVVGAEGPSLFKDGKMWLPDPSISIGLGDWIGPESAHSTLWISSAVAAQGYPGSRAAARFALVAAWESKLPIISHFCVRPYSGDLPEGRTVEQAGMIGLVYSLIVQLLQFNVEDDAFQISKDLLEKLNGSEESWPEALLLLHSLLRTTPQVQRCIIDGLNDLCFSSGAEWCNTLLNMLFEHQKTSASGFKILLTTSGQSRVLPSYVLVEDRVLVQRAAREVIRGGRWLDAVKK